MRQKDSATPKYQSILKTMLKAANTRKTLKIESGADENTFFKTRISSHYGFDGFIVGFVSLENQSTPEKGRREKKKGENPAQIRAKFRCVWLQTF